MHHPAAIEAEPSPEKRGERLWLADHILLPQGRRYSPKREIYAGQSTSAVQTAPFTRYNRRFLNAHQHSIRRGTAPWATGATEVMEAALTGISGMFLCFLLSVVWLSSLRGIRTCGGRHGLGCRLGLLVLFVFRFMLLGF